jgi:hypothetical protein
LQENAFTSIGKSNGLFHRPRPPTPCHSAPAGARAWRRPAPLAPPTLASTPPGRARGAPRHRAPPRAAGHGQDGWLGTGCQPGWGGLERTDSNTMRAVKGVMRAGRDCYQSSCNAGGAAEGSCWALSCSERRVHTRAGVPDAAMARGTAYGQPRDALGGWAGRRTAMPPQQQRGNRRRRTRRQLPGTGQRPTRRGQAFWTHPIRRRS